MHKAEKPSYKGRETTIRVEDGNKVLSSATGSSPDEALRALFSELYSQVQSLTKPEAIQSRIDQMNSALNEARYAVSYDTITYCTSIMSQARGKQHRLSEEKKARIEKASKTAVENQIVPVKKPSTPKKKTNAHKRMIAEQRRLMTDSLRYDILARDGFRCRICGASAADGAKLHVDHIIPVSKGGKTEKSNLRTLCERCNLGKGDKVERIPVPSTPTETKPSQPSAPKDIPKNIPKGTSKGNRDVSLNKLVQLLTDSGIRYVDNTARGGCFWIEKTSESETLLNGKTVDGRKIYVAKSSKAFNKTPAFFVK